MNCALLLTLVSAARTFRCRSRRGRCGAGYGCVLLDTLDDMEAARALYENLGFVEVPPYCHNPIAGSHYLKVALRPAPA